MKELRTTYLGITNSECRCKIDLWKKTAYANQWFSDYSH
jgi:hypothetical protein